MTLIAALLAILTAATPQDLADAQAVAACESGHRQPDGTATPGTHRWDAHNPTSTASGAFQFLDSTWTWTLDTAGIPPLWDTAADAPPIVQLAAFLHLWDNRAGAPHWHPSRPCWDPLPTAP